MEIRARILRVVAGVGGLRGEVDQACYDLRRLALDAARFAVAPSIPAPDGTDLPVLAIRLSRHPAPIEAQGGAPP